MNLLSIFIFFISFQTNQVLLSRRWNWVFKKLFSTPSTRVSQLNSVLLGIPTEDNNMNINIPSSKDKNTTSDIPSAWNTNQASSDSGSGSGIGSIDDISIEIISKSIKEWLCNLSSFHVREKNQARQEGLEQEQGQGAYQYPSDKKDNSNLCDAGHTDDVHGVINMNIFQYYQQFFSHMSEVTFHYFVLFIYYIFIQTTNIIIIICTVCSNIIKYICNIGL